MDIALTLSLGATERLIAKSQVITKNVHVIYQYWVMK